MSIVVLLPPTPLSRLWRGPTLYYDYDYDGAQFMCAPDHNTGEHVDFLCLILKQQKRKGRINSNVLN